MLTSPEEIQPKETIKKVKSFKTARGSEYTYLPDGRTQRFKAATDSKKEPQDAIVFIPDYQTLYDGKPDDWTNETFYSYYGENEAQYKQILLEGIHYPENRVYIIDTFKKRVYTNEQVHNSKRVFLAYYSNEEFQLYLPVASNPKIGYKPFDTRRYISEDGTNMTERHIGNPIIEIEYHT